MVVLTNICRNFRIANQARIRHVASMLDSLPLWIPGKKLGGILVRFCVAKPSDHGRFAPCLDIGAAAHLTYNDHYFQSGKKSFHFVRQKIEDRSDMEVVIPNIPPLQTILDQIAAPPIKGSLVFPGIYGDAQTPIDRRKRVAMENQNIKKRVRRLVKSMGHSVDSNITNRYIDAFPLAQQMEFNSRLLKLNDDADIMEELKGLTPEQLKTLIALVKNS